jgi:hypothetical protein
MVVRVENDEREVLRDAGEPGASSSFMDEWVHDLDDKVSQMQLEVLSPSLLIDAWCSSIPASQRPDWSTSVESAHPFDAGSTRVHTVHRDGARSLLLIPSQMCEFGDGHAMKITLDPAGLRELGTIGRVGRDTSAVYVPGDTAYVHFPVAAFEAYACGSNVSSNLGVAASGDALSPQGVDALHGQQIIDAAGGDSCVMLTAGGRVITTGKVLAGVDSPRDAPRLVASLARFEVVGITVGGGGALAWCANGETFGWGNLPCINTHKTPKVVELLGGIVVAGAALGEEHCLVVDGAGRVFSWGCGDALGHGAVTDVDKPRMIEALKAERVFAVYASGEVSIAISVSMTAAVASTSFDVPAFARARRARPPPFSEVAGVRTNVWSWGSGDGSLTGHGDEEQLESPLLIDAFAEECVWSIALGESHALALTLDGRVFGWGCHASGELGLGVDAAKVIEVPTELPLGDTVAALQVSAGACHSAMLVCQVPPGSKKEAARRHKRPSARPVPVQIQDILVTQVQRARKAARTRDSGGSEASGSGGDDDDAEEVVERGEEEDGESGGDDAGTEEDGGSGSGGEEEEEEEDAASDGSTHDSAPASKPRGGGGAVAAALALAPGGDGDAADARAVLTCGARRNGRLGHGQARGIEATACAVEGLPRHVVIERVLASENGTFAFGRPRRVIPVHCGGGDEAPAATTAAAAVDAGAAVAAGGPWGFELKVVPSLTAAGLAKLQPPGHLAERCVVWWCVAPC